MAGQRTTFNKLQRERAKKAKAAAKRERRQDRDSGATPETAAADTLTLAPDEQLSAPRLLELIESIHKQFEAGTLSYEEFEEKKTELLARLPVD
ncbi:MAG: hypothetical protein M3314_15260 [Actinomycetota bacterium]|nr:hypothetical protein [Actinomycetota bacterium]